MKVQIRKYETGGSALPLVDYMPFTGVARAPSATSAAAEADNQSIGLKDLLKLTEKLEGLPVDSALIADSIKNMYTEASLFNDGQISTDKLVTTYLSALQKINVAKFNQDQFNDATDQVVAKGGYNEVAIDEQGKLFVQNTNTGTVTKLSVDQFRQLQKAKPEEYEALTNSNLLSMRANNPSFAFQNNILRTVSNGIGEKQVTELLLQTANGIGKDSLQREGYSTKSASKIESGMGVLQTAYEQGMTVDGLYKQGYINEEQKTQTQAALQYLWRTLPENAKTFLKYKSGKEDSDTGAIELMSNLLFSRNTTVQKYTQDLVKNPADGDGSGTSKSGNDFLSNIQAGTRGRDAVFHVNLGGKYGNTGMSISGTAYGMAITPSGQPIGQDSMYDMLQESRLAGITDGLNNIYFGEQRVPVEVLKNIAYAGDDIMRVNIPVHADGSPNFDLLKIYNDAQQEFLLSNQTAEDRLRIFGAKPELVSLINSDGTLNMSKFAPYILVNGVTTDSLAKIDKSNGYVSEAKADPNLYKLIKTSLTTGSGKTLSVPKINEYSWGDAVTKGWGEWFNSYDHIYKGVVYIPIDMNRGSAAMYSSVNLSKTEGNQMELEYQQNPAFLNYNANGNSASLLNNS